MINVKRLKKLLLQDDNEERCGLILRNNKIIECPNVAEDTVKGFEIDPEALVKYEKTMVGTWHTHPGEGSNLSERDYLGFLQWPKLSHYIIGLNGVSRYVVEDGIVLNAD